LPEPIAMMLRIRGNGLSVGWTACAWMVDIAPS
jgi:hypothetical protein